MQITPESTLQAFLQTPLTTTTAADLAAAPGAGLRYLLTDIRVSNAHATVGTVVRILSAATVVWEDWVPANSRTPEGLAVPIGTGVNEALKAQCVTAGAAVRVAVSGVKVRGSAAAQGYVPPPAAYDPTTFFTGGTGGFSYLFDVAANNKNASSAAAANGEAVALVEDAGAGNYDASQSTNANRPLLITNGINATMSVIEVDTTDLLSIASLDSFLNAATSFTFGMVWKPTDFADNHIYFEQEKADFNSRVQMGGTGSQVRVDYNPDATVNNGNIQYSGSNVLTAGVWSVVLIQIDATNRTVAMYANNATFKAPTVVTGPAQAFNTGGTNSRLLRNAKGRMAHAFCHKNALMDSTQRTNWFAAVKTRYGLTAY